MNNKTSNAVVLRRDAFTEAKKMARSVVLSRRFAKLAVLVEGIPLLGKPIVKAIFPQPARSLQRLRGVASDLLKDMGEAQIIFLLNKDRIAQIKKLLDTDPDYESLIRYLYNMASLDEEKKIEYIPADPKSKNKGVIVTFNAVKQ